MTDFHVYDVVDTVNARQHLDDLDWTMIDSCIVNWVYTSVLSEIL